MNLGKTESVCPVCLKRIPAERTARGGDVYLDKLCPEHGAFSAIVWRGGLGKEFDKWRSYAPPAGADLSSISIPGNKTCCALVEVTKRCNLRCPVCFAESGDLAGGSPAEPSVAELFETFRALADAGNTFVQLSGGEPTVRDDLPEIVAAARRAGCETVQLNSNGRRLGRETGFTKALAGAGLSFVFMQFDGVTDGVYEALRGAPLFEEKLAAIEVCDRENIGVTLVPTLVPGVNDRELGEIIAFAVRHSPAVRGV
ncbi:MAG: radical SAM protein, partial [Oscillospiraceae bacterium]|nr:radical SAM protein [Oscillospiraceae bacterium]